MRGRAGQRRDSVDTSASCHPSECGQSTPRGVPQAVSKAPNCRRAGAGQRCGKRGCLYCQLSRVCRQLPEGDCVHKAQFPCRVSVGIEHGDVAVVAGARCGEAASILLVADSKCHRVAVARARVPSIGCAESGEDERCVGGDCRAVDLRSNAACVAGQQLAPCPRLRLKQPASAIVRQQVLKGRSALALHRVHPAGEICGLWWGRG